MADVGADPRRNAERVAGWVGRRVVVRRRAGVGAAGRPAWSDVLGVLVEAGGDGLAVRTTDGAVLRVPAADVHRVAPVPPSAADVLELEEVAALGWRPHDSEWLGGWLLRAARGWTNRGNSALPLRDPGLPLDAALDRLRRWYAERGLPAQLQVPLPARRPLDAALATRGWTAHAPVRVLTAALPALLASLPARPDLPPLEVASRPSEQWLAAYHYRGSPLPPHAVELMTAAAHPLFAAVRDGSGEVLAIARAVLDRGWAGVTAVEVTPAARRRGLARHVMRGLAERTAADGAARMWLQVADENAPALALYASLEFDLHHRYHYRTAPA